MRLEVAKDLVRARCWGICEGCGTYGAVIEIHHRLARGAGGVSRAAGEAANDPTNLLALCATRCHPATEHADTWRECEGKGWRIRRALTVPADVPALIYTVNGYGWWYLTPDGGYRFADTGTDYRIPIFGDPES